MAKRHYDSDRTRSERDGSSMIRENRSAIANLPQEVMIKPYPRGGNYMYSELNDDLSGVDAQMSYDDNKRNAHFHPKKV